jgi:hypothetical protein
MMNTPRQLLLLLVARASARDNNPVSGDIIFGNVTKEEYFMNDFYGLIENVMRFYYCFISHFQRQ